MKKLLSLFVMSGAVLAALFFLTNNTGSSAGQSTQTITLKPGSAVQEGSIVSIEYTLTDDSGKVIDTSVGKEPLTYIHGAGQIVKGLERELNGLKVGDQKKVRRQTGRRLRPAESKRLSRNPEGEGPRRSAKVGRDADDQSPRRPRHPDRVPEVNEKTVVVDFNHPLAGKTLHFDVKVKDIKAAETR